MRRALGKPLRAVIIPQEPDLIYQVVYSTVHGLGLEIVTLADPDDDALTKRGRASARNVDLLVLVIDQSSIGLDTLARSMQPYAQHPTFLCLHSAFQVEEGGSDVLHTIGAASLQPVATVHYDGSQDMRWKLGQTLCGFLSARFREAQLWQMSLLEGNGAVPQRTIVKLAQHRDIQHRQMATRLATGLAAVHPDDAAAIARKLVASGRTSSYVIAVQVLNGMVRQHGDLASHLLYELTTSSPRFRTWAFSRLER